MARRSDLRLPQGRTMKSDGRPASCSGLRRTTHVPLGRASCERASRRDQIVTITQDRGQYHALLTCQCLLTRSFGPTTIAVENPPTKSKRMMARFTQRAGNALAMHVQSLQKPVSRCSAFRQLPEARLWRTRQSNQTCLDHRPKAAGLRVPLRSQRT